jgi:hypothetical protein
VADDSISTLKRQLADAILEISDGMPVTVAARGLGINPARVCDLRGGRIDRFSVERLIRIISTVGGEVTLSVSVPRQRDVCWFPKLRARRQEFLAAVRSRRHQLAQFPHARRRATALAPMEPMPPEPPRNGPAPREVEPKELEPKELEAAEPEATELKATELKA